MAERVVDDLETVKVDEQHREIAVIAARVPQLDIEHFAEHRAVWKSGQRVVFRQLLDARFGLLALGDILAHPAIALERARAIENRLAADAGPDFVSGRVHPAQLQIPEWPARIENRPVRGPILRGHVHVVLFPALRADEQELLRIERGRARAGKRGEAVLLILLPVRVGGKLRQAAETLLAPAKRHLGNFVFFDFVPEQSVDPEKFLRARLDMRLELVLEAPGRQRQHLVRRSSVEDPGVSVQVQGKFAFVLVDQLLPLRPRVNVVQLVDLALQAIHLLLGECPLDLAAAQGSRNHPARVAAIRTGRAATKRTLQRPPLFPAAFLDFPAILQNHRGDPQPEQGANTRILSPPCLRAMGREHTCGTHPRRFPSEMSRIRNASVTG